MLPIRKAIQELGVHPNTLRRWENEGKITPHRTQAGQRRYNIADIRALLQANAAADAANADNAADNGAAAAAAVVDPEPKPVENKVVYCRVSSAKQRADLQRQQTFMQRKYPTYEVVSDVSSGTHYNRPGMQRLLERIMRREITAIAAYSKDRIGRFGYDLFARICEFHGVELIIIKSEDNSPQEELADDIITIVTSFAAKAHGMRKYRADPGEDYPDD